MFTKISQYAESCSSSRLCSLWFQTSFQLMGHGTGFSFHRKKNPGRAKRSLPSICTCYSPVERPPGGDGLWEVVHQRPARAASGQHAAPPSDLTGEGASQGLLEGSGGRRGGPPTELCSGFLSQRPHRAFGTQIPSEWLQCVDPRYTLEYHKMP